MVAIIHKDRTSPWLEGVKKEINQKQELMFQMMIMEMMQAKHPVGRRAYGLIPSF